MKKYNLQVYVAPRINPHHPEGGWFTTRKDAVIEEVQLAIERSNSILDRASKQRSTFRIIDVETGEEIK